MTCGSGPGGRSVSRLPTPPARDDRQLPTAGIPTAHAAYTLLRLRPVISTEDFPASQAPDWPSGWRWLSRPVRCPPGLRVALAGLSPDKREALAVTG